MNKYKKAYFKEIRYVTTHPNPYHDTSLSTRVSFYNSISLQNKS